MNAPTAASPTADFVSIVAAMRGDEIRKRLHEIEAERLALQVLLRSVAARERAAARRANREEGEVGCAD